MSSVDLKQPTSRASYILVFFTLFNFAAIILLTVYHIEYERNVTSRLTGVNPVDSKAILTQLFKDFKKDILPSHDRRDVPRDVSRDQQQTFTDRDEVLSVLQEFMNSQKPSLAELCRTTTRHEVVEVLKDAIPYLNPAETKYKRQSSTSAGNELANLFGEIAKSEVDILTQYCNNGSLVCLPGAKGDPGVKGDPGTQGSSGLPGQQGVKGAQGAVGIKGNTGAQGLNGTDGLDGVKGNKGDVGGRGLPGSDGADGKAGTDGVDGLPGIQGNKGDVGGRGLTGNDGADGKAGTDGVDGLPGVQGVKGDIGSQGPRGVKGEMGTRGPQGTIGVQGDKGNDGSLGLPGLNGLTGAKGDMGPAGSRGVKGDMGSIGAQGTQGPQGSPGLPGPKGNKGDASDIPVQTACCLTLTSPEFQTNLEEIRVTEGTDVTMNCDVAGYPPPAITWTPQVSRLDATRTTVSPQNLQIVNSLVSDSKTYTCSAKSPLGSAQKQFSLTVYKHIRFEELPTNHTVMMGRPVVFECKVDGPLTPTVKWFKIMPDGSRFPITSGITPINDGSQLRLDSVTKSREGKYICEGNNGVETIDQSVFLSTYGPPHIIPPGTVTALSGQNITLRCDADAHPPATFTWNYPPGVTNAYTEKDGTLVVINGQPKDSTYFTCIATNQYGTDSAQLTLKVNAPPSVTVVPDNIPLNGASTNIALECKATGDAPLTVTWTKDGAPVASNGHTFVLPGNVLLVNQATILDHGVYTCMASNAVGTDSASAYAYDQMGQITCSTPFSACKNTVCGATCPANCRADISHVYGFMEYTFDSSLCKASIQAGSITGAGGPVIWSTEHKKTAFNAGNQNGIVSTAYPSGPPTYVAKPIV